METLKSKKFWAGLFTAIGTLLAGNEIGAETGTSILSGIGSFVSTILTLLPLV